MEEREPDWECNHCHKWPVGSSKQNCPNCGARRPERKGVTADGKKEPAVADPAGVRAGRGGGD